MRVDIILISAFSGKTHTISLLDMVLVLRLRYKIFHILLISNIFNDVEYVKCFSRIYNDKYVISPDI